MPGAAGLHLAAGLGLLRPEEQAFTAMLDGWAARQLARAAGVHFALDALDSYAAAPDDPHRMAPTQRKSRIRPHPASRSRRRGR